MNTSTLENLEQHIAVQGSEKQPITIIVEKEGQTEEMVGHIIQVMKDGFLFYPTIKPASETALKPPLLHTKKFHADRPTVDGYTFKSIEKA